MTAEDAVTMAQRYYETKLADAETWLRSVDRSKVDWAIYRDERTPPFSCITLSKPPKICFLLVHTFYFPRSHNIKLLRSFAEDVDQGLIAAWPREHRLDRRRFETLKRAYVEARYSDRYDVSPEDLTAIAGSATRLRDRVAEACRDRIAALQTAAAGS